MVPIVSVLAQTTSDVGDEVAQGSGAVLVIGFLVVGFGAVIGAYVFRRRKGCPPPGTQRRQPVSAIHHSGPYDPDVTESKPKSRSVTWLG